MIRLPYRSDLQSGVPRWRPLVSLYVHGPKERRLSKGLLDTGSDDSILPNWLANSLGVQLALPGGHRIVWRGQPYSMQIGTVELELTDEAAGFQWLAAVGFSSAPVKYAILGIRGCLQFFDATFCGREMVVELTINRSFQGSVL